MLYLPLPFLPGLLLMDALTSWELFGFVLWKVLYFGVTLFTIGMILLENRNPVKTIAWILFICFLPVVGIVFYFFFGRDTRHTRLISRKMQSRLRKRPMLEFRLQSTVALDPAVERIASFFTSAKGALLFDGNQVEPLTDGTAFLQAFLREIYRAERYIHVQYYIIEDDAVGRLVRDALIDKAREGVEVKVLYDDVGSWHTRKRFFDEMERHGIRAYSFLKVVFPFLTGRVNYRNHRKLTVVDGKVGFIGGLNLALRYLRSTPEIGGIWRDTVLLLRGRGVYGLQTSFLFDWCFTAREMLTSARYFPVMGSMGGGIVQVVTSDPVSPWRGIMQGLTMAIERAQRYFYIQTPYFLPTEPILVALQTAALAGVDVRLMVPARTDAPLVGLATASYMRDMLQAGVKVYLYERGFLHSKLMVSDDIFSTVGSTNMDFRSFEHNFEANAFLYDAGTAVRLRDIFLSDQQGCSPLYLNSWEKRPRLRRFGESVMRLFSPLL